MAQPSAPQVSQETFNAAAEMLVSGVPASEAASSLVEKLGLTPDAAAHVVSQLQKVRKTPIPNMELDDPAPRPAVGASSAIATGAIPLPVPQSPAPATRLDVTQFSSDPEIQDVYRAAAEMLEAGASGSQAMRRLQERFGIDHEAAGMVTAHVQDALAASGMPAGWTAADIALAREEQGRNRMVYGACWLVGGLLVTGLTCAAASGAGGGTYVIAWGAVLCGIIEIFRGAAMMRKG